MASIETAPRKTAPITPFLWFDGQAQEAAEFYVSVFEDSRIVKVVPYGESGPGTPGSAMTVRFEIGGQPFMALNGGPEFTFSEAVSFMVECETQEEIDYYWNALTEGGEESQCGWLKDRFGLSWQVASTRLGELLDDPDHEAANRVMQAMLQMKKIDIAELERAYAGVAVA